MGIPHRSRETTVAELVSVLDDHGCVVVDDLIPRSDAQAISDELRNILVTTPTGRTDFEGHLTRRIYAVFAKTRCLDGVATHPLVRGVLDEVIGHHQLSAPTVIEIGPGEKAQVLHHDDGIYPLPHPHDEVVFNTMWAFDNFTDENGATRVVVGSHRRPELPAEPSIDLATMSMGSVLLYVGSIWHGGGDNRTDRPRLGAAIEYVASWLRPQENNVLAVPPEVVATLSEDLQELLGYNVRPPFLGYVDGRHPRRVLQSR
jgi:ectoine hydroxylase-related dioxygenase (phytanoyl-CoA dioxygenase family)